MSPLNRTIEIIIAPDGSSRLETKGFLGADCRDASRFIEQALGQPTLEVLKSEFHQVASNEQHVQQNS